MPTILKIFGLRACIYPNDHRPAHVHVIGNGCEVVVKLGCPDGPPDPRENHGFSKKELSKILTELALQLPHLCKEWKDIHGNY